MMLYLGLLLNWINYTFLYFMWCHDLIKTKVYYCMFFWHFIYCIPFKFAYWKNNKQQQQQYGVTFIWNTCIWYLLPYIFTLSFHSFHGFIKLASDVSLHHFLHNSGSSTQSFVAISAIVQVRIYLWQLSYSTQCIYVASDLEMLFSCLTSVEWETNREKNCVSKKVELQNTPTDCVIATDQW